MKSIFRWVGYCLIWTLYIAALFLWINGVSHAFKRHSGLDGFASFFPVWGVYRGAESFWHKEPDKYAKVNWDKRIKSDISIACDLIGSSLEKRYSTEIKEAIEEFSTKISDYPNDKFQMIKNGALSYIKFNIAATEEFFDYAKSTQTGEKSNFEFSDSTKIIYDSLYNYYGLIEIQVLKNILDSSANETDYSTMDSFEVNSIKKKAPGILSTYKEMYSASFYRIFNEKISL